MLLEFEGFTLTGVVAATVLPFMIGFLWYGKPLFGAAWQKFVGLSDKDIQNANMAQTMGISLIAAFVKASFIGAIIHALDSEPSVLEGLITGGAIATGIAGMTVLNQYLFAQRRKKLLLIDAGYIITEMAAMGAVLAWL